MNVVDSRFIDLSAKANRLFYYIEKTVRDTLSLEEINQETRKRTAELLDTLRCEGCQPSHQDIFFLLKLFNSDVRLNNLSFIQQNLETQLDKIQQEMDHLNIINFKFNK